MACRKFESSNRRGEYRACKHCNFSQADHFWLPRRGTTVYVPTYVQTPPTGTLTVSADVVCGDCSLVVATVECRECHEKYCERCCDAAHSKGRRSGHRDMHWIGPGRGTRYWHGVLTTREKQCPPDPMGDRLLATQREARQQLESRTTEGWQATRSERKYQGDVVLDTLYQDPKSSVIRDQMSLEGLARRFKEVQTEERRALRLEQEERLHGISVAPDVRRYNEIDEIERERSANSRRSQSIMWITLASVLSLPLLLLLTYRILTSTIRKPKPVPRFDSKSIAFERQRRGKFPPPYPNGWYKLWDLADLASGVSSVSAFGQNLVGFRHPTTGAIGVLDAFCPHMGTHLGTGTVLPNGTLQCAFHGWQFDVTGKCQHIPYTTGGCAPPKQAQAKAWVHREYMGMVFVWFDAEGREPLYELESLGVKHTWERLVTRQSEYAMHMSDMAENSADYFHFNFLHSPMPIPLIGRLFSIRHDTKLFFPEEPERAHICFFNNNAEIWFWKRYLMAFTRQLTTVTFEGPSLVHFDVKTPLGGVHLVKTLLPLEPFRIYSEDAWFKEPRTPRWLLHVIAYIAKGALEQDRIVWESRLYNPKPVLVAGDGPFQTHRRWWTQFYSEHSREVAYGANDLSW